MEALAASREHLAGMLPRPPIRSRMCPKRGKKPGKPLGFKWTASPYQDDKGKENSPKVSDQYGNVYENKGSAILKPGQNGNVIENKGTYALKAGMLMKISMLAGSREPFIPNLTSCDALGCHAGRGQPSGPSPCRTPYVQKRPRDQ